MAGPALAEACSLTTFPAARLAYFERERIRAEWRNSNNIVSLSLRKLAPHYQDQNRSPTVLLMLLVVAAMLTFITALLGELAGGHFLGAMLATLSLSACVLSATVLKTIRARSPFLRIGTAVAFLVIVAVPMKSISGNHGGEISVSLVICALLTFTLAYLSQHSMPLVRIIGGMMLRPRTSLDLLNQSIRLSIRFGLIEDGVRVQIWSRPESARTTRRKWLTEAENIILDRLIQVINELLGGERPKLLVTQHSEGLRRLNDPGLIVPTQSQQRVQRALDQMDGGSLAIAGPRGSGKSTLLRKMCEPHYNMAHAIERETSVPPNRLAVLVLAPAEYNPKEFVVELFLQSCEAYLTYRGYKPQFRTRKLSIGRRGRLSRVIRNLVIMLLRAATSLTLLGLVVWSIRNTLISPIVHIRDLGQDISEQIRLETRELWKRENRGFSQIILSVMAFLAFPRNAVWRLLRHRRLPEAVHVARTYQNRLRQEKTTTTGVGGTLTPFAFSGSSAVKDHPWTMPQLVGDLRSFLSIIAEEIKTEGRVLVIGIDEVDRIGTAEQAARFLNEIKAVFGVSNCIFVVSVADDIGSIFARRAVAGRSVFENAFDDLVTIEPLSLDEARELLQVRVEGFAEPFVVLAYALSGGLPRELIRVTRRMVELKDKASQPRVGELAELLAEEELYEVIEGTRSQLGSLTLDETYGPILALTLEASIALKGGSAFRPAAYALATLRLPSVNNSQDVDKIFSELRAFADFCMAIAQAFEFFDPLKSRELTEADSSASYEKLAMARRELSLSPASSCRILANFRAHHGLVF